MATIIQLRRDTAANWSSVDPVLDNGEIGIETDTRKMKIGNGSSTWTALQYAKPHIGELSVNDLQDVVITSASSGQVLKYNGTNWVNAVDSTGTTISSIDDINDVVITSVSAGQVLEYDGTNWINATPSGGTATVAIHPFAMLG